MTFTAKELEARIESAKFDYDLVWDAIWNEDYTDEQTDLGEPFGAFEVVKSFGGEGKGDSAWVVIRAGGRLFRKDGYYASYDGAEFDGEFTEVEEYQKTVTAYRPVSG